jgi:hypothetical protein
MRRIAAGCGENAAHLGMRHDAGAAPGQLHLGPLVDGDLAAHPAQQDGGEQPAHRAADDQRARVARFAQSCGFLAIPSCYIIAANITGGSPWP